MYNGGIHALVHALSMEKLMFIFLLGEVELHHITIVLELLARDLVEPL
jgi:hypothetical protein